MTRLGTELEHALVISIGDLIPATPVRGAATEIAIGEIAAEFDGEDQLQPETRARLDGYLDSCGSRSTRWGDYAEISLAEPGEDDVAQVRRLIAGVVAG